MTVLRAASTPESGPLCPGNQDWPALAPHRLPIHPAARNAGSNPESPPDRHPTRPRHDVLDPAEVLMPAVCSSKRGNPPAGEETRSLAETVLPIRQIATRPEACKHRPARPDNAGLSSVSPDEDPFHDRCDLLPGKMLFDSMTWPVSNVGRLGTKQELC